MNKPHYLMNLEVLILRSRYFLILNVDCLITEISENVIFNYIQRLYNLKELDLSCISDINNNR